jgi:hypothetical protein
MVIRVNTWAGNWESVWVAKGVNQGLIARDHYMGGWGKVNSWNSLKSVSVWVAGVQGWRAWV